MKIFKHNNFKYLFASEMSYRAASWIAALVFTLLTKEFKGNSAFYASLVGFIFNLPMLFLTPFSGVIADRNNRLNVLKITSFCLFVISIIMLINIYGLSNYWLMMLVLLLMGICTAIRRPTSDAFLRNTIGTSADLGVAVGLYTSGGRVLQFVGYGIGGIIFAKYGPSMCLIFVATLYLLSYLSLQRINHTYLPRSHSGSSLQNLREGIDYIFNNLPVVIIISLVSLIGLLAWPYMFQMAIVNAYVFNGTPRTLGLLLSISGVGSLIAGILLIKIKNHFQSIKLIIFSTLLLGISFALLSHCRTVSYAVPATFLIDLSITSLMGSASIFLQHIIANDFRGRVMGIYTMAAVGTIPIGSLLFYGGLGHFLGPMNVFLIVGLFLIFTSLGLFIIRAKLQLASSSVVR